jgi:hypothetical protein
MNLMTKRIEALEAAAAKHYNGVVTKVVRSQSEIEAIARAGLTERFAEADAVFAAYPDPARDEFDFPESTRWAFAALKAGAPMAEVRAGKWSKGPYQPNKSDSSSRP